MHEGGARVGIDVGLAPARVCIEDLEIATYLACLSALGTCSLVDTQLRLLWHGERLGGAIWHDLGQCEMHVTKTQALTFC